MLRLILVLAAHAEEPEDGPPDFGMDLTAGYAIGALLGEWPEPEPAGAAWINAGLYPVPSTVGGPRLGAAMWAEMSLPPKQSATETHDDVPTTFPFTTTHYGLAVSMRYDPAAPWSGAVDFGFGRLDLEEYYGGPMAIPTFSVRAGVRRRVGPLFVEGAGRVAWGAARDPAEVLTDWWLVNGQLGLGLHVR